MTPTPEKLKFGQVIEQLDLLDAQKEELRAQFKDKLDQTVDMTTLQLDALNDSIGGAKRAKKWPQLRMALKNMIDAVDDVAGGGSKGKSKKKIEGKREDAPVPPTVPENKESADVVSLRKDIDEFMKKDGIAGNPAAGSIMAEFTKKLSEPGISPDTLAKLREQFHNIQTQMANFEIKNVSDIQEKIRNYTESREIKTPETNMLFFSALTHEMYKLGFRITFERGGVVKVV